MEPFNYELSSYPLPLDREIAIQFSLPQATWTSILILDRFGEEVSTLLEGEYLQPGTYAFPLKVKNLPPGSCRIKVQTLHGSRATRIALLK
jgi:hypothetical protein